MNFLESLISFVQTEDKYLSCIVSVPMNFLLMMSYFLVFSYVLNITVTKKQKNAYIISSGIIITFLTSFFSLNIYRLIFLIINIFLIIRILKADIFKAILAQCITVVIAATVETLLYFYITHFFENIGIENVFYVVKYRIIIILSICIFSLSIYAFVKRFKLQVKYIPINKRINLLITALLGMVVMSAQVSQIVMDQNQNISLNFVVNIIAMCLLFYLVINNVSKFSEIEKYQSQIEELELYNKTLLENQDKLRTFKHDYNNIVQAIGGYVISDNLDGLKNFYKELVKDCQEVNRNSMLNPDIINNPVVFNIISNKFFYAKENKIEMNIDVFMDLNILNIKPYELAKILGILIDNAIEAANECDTKIINIIFREEKNNKRQVMIIENTYLNQEIDVIRIFEKNFSTKKRNSGIGLWEVRNILNKSANLNLHTSKNDKYFKQQLEMYA